MEQKLEIASMNNTSNMLKISALNGEQQTRLSSIIAELIDLPVSRCHYNSTGLPSDQNGLTLRFDSGYWGFSLDLFEKLHHLGLMKYSNETPSPHYTDDYLHDLTVNSERDRSLHVAEALCYKIITEVNYQGVVALHENWLNLAKRMVALLNKHISQPRQFKANACGVSIITDSSFLDSPAYSYFIVPLIEQICKKSPLGLKFSHAKIVFTRI